MNNILTNRFITPALLTAGFLGAATTHAAGGHFIIDDATILDPGRCHVETWVEHNGGTTLTLGPACHAGGVEWSLGLEGPTTGSLVTWSVAPQAKVAFPLPDERFAVGAAVGLVLADQLRDFEGAYALVPFTWTAAWGDVHLNAGYDWNRNGKDILRGGASAYAPLHGPVDGVVAVFAENGDWSSQAGLRFWLVPGSVSLDGSVTRGLHRGGDGWVLTAGLTMEFDRP
jgi:hypothetical protein